MKDFRVAEHIFPFGVTQYESLQFSGRRGQHNAAVSEALVSQIELMSITQLLEPVVIHQSDGDRVLADRQSRKGMRPHKGGQEKAIVLVRVLWVKIEKRHAAQLDQSRFEPGGPIFYVQEFIMVFPRFGERTSAAGVAYPRAEQGVIEDDILLSKERVQRGDTAGEYQCGSQYNEGHLDASHFSP